MRAAIRPLSAAPRLALAARRAASTNMPAQPKHEHHSPADIPPPPPPGVPVDPQLNGYPQLPEISLQSRSPYGWWDPQERKNFGEVVHEKEDRLGMWGPDVHKISGGKALGALSFAAFLIFIFGQVVKATQPEPPVARRTYPYNGLEKALGGSVGARKEDEFDLQEE